MPTCVLDGKPPVFEFENGDMYIGSWKDKGPNGYPVEHGDGIYYNNYPKDAQGLIYAGGWRNGKPHGKGGSFWLESAPTWIANFLEEKSNASFIMIPKKDGSGVPFSFKGRYYNGKKHCEEGYATLKDGTSRKGPWKNDLPVENSKSQQVVGNWYNHQLLREPKMKTGEEQESFNLVLQDGTHTHDGARGKYGVFGNWITQDEAMYFCVGRDKWWLGARCQEAGVDVSAILSASEKPIWMYSNNDMYIGTWKDNGPNGHPVEHGKGICYHGDNSVNETWAGFIFAGDWKDGEINGKGHSFWHEAAPTWVSNSLIHSRVTLTKNQKSRGIPYCYSGSFKNDGKRHDKNAFVTLKDGTIRRGPWENGTPKGTTWHNHKLISGPNTQPAPSSAVSSRARNENSSHSIPTDSSKLPAARKYTDEGDAAASPPKKKQKVNTPSPDKICPTSHSSPPEDSSIIMSLVAKCTNEEYAAATPQRNQLVNNPSPDQNCESPPNLVTSSSISSSGIAFVYW